MNAIIMLRYARAKLMTAALSKRRPFRVLTILARRARDHAWSKRRIILESAMGDTPGIDDPRP